jgi:hypothetical protein
MGQRKKAGESSPAFAYSEGELFVYPTTSPYELTLEVDSYVHSLSFVARGVVPLEYSPTFVTVTGRTEYGEVITLSSRSLFFDKESPDEVKMLFSAKAVEEKLSERLLVGLTTHSGSKCPYPVLGRAEIQAAGCGIYNSNFELLVKDKAYDGLLCTKNPFPFHDMQK